MLFDLRGAGRRSTVKIVYLFLAILMGGGLILFGIGGSVSGGLVDAITGSNSTSSTSTSTYRKRAQEAEATARAEPKNAAAWAAAARARYQLATASEFADQSTGQFSAAGKEQLQLASASWQRHLALEPAHADDSVAGLMVKAYSQFGLNDPAKAVAAQEVITEARPKAATFATLAILAYQAGQTRKGDLASAKAISLADDDQKAGLKSQLDSAKQQSVQQQLQNATPTPTATPTPKKKSEKKNSGGR